MLWAKTIVEFNDVQRFLRFFASKVILGKKSSRLSEQPTFGASKSVPDRVLC